MIARRLRALGIALLGLAVCVAAAAIDAGTRAPLDGAAIDAFVARTGSSELALSTTSRWLRHPASAEPGAACQDQPPCLDVDPAGLAIAPPRAWFEGRGALVVEVERGEAAR
ncbi:MAG: hypothetical protein ACK6CU_11240 [Deltaproteobacteria bacterium]|jgi:hypothetical protein